MISKAEHFFHSNPSHSILYVHPYRSRTVGVVASVGPEDIALLVDHFIKKFRGRSPRPIHGISAEALAVLRRYPFPGNVRELENAIEHAFVMCHGQEIQLEHLPQHIVNYSVSTNGISGHLKSDKEIILEVLRRHRGNRVRAAAELGVHRSTLWRKMRSYNIDA